MSVTVYRLAPSQTSNCKQQKADAQVSILLAAFPVRLRIVWQQQVFSVAGGEQQLWLAGHILTAHNFPIEKGKDLAVTHAQYQPLKQTGLGLLCMCQSCTSMHGIGLPIPQEIAVYLDFWDRLQCQHVQNIVTLTFPDQACTNC